MGRVWAIGVICLAVGGCAKLDTTAGNMFGSTGKAEAVQQMSYRFDETPTAAPAEETAPATKAKRGQKHTRASKTAAPASE